MINDMTNALFRKFKKKNCYYYEIRYNIKNNCPKTSRVRPDCQGFRSEQGGWVSVEIRAWKNRRNKEMLRSKMENRKDNKIMFMYVYIYIYICVCTNRELAKMSADCYLHAAPRQKSIHNMI